MKYLSVCSGIEAASVAWEPLGWTPVGFSEIEPFPSAVLKHHYPDVPNFGDFTTIDPEAVAHADVLVGGTPCQAFSVAGLRGSLDDARGNLSLAFVRLADAIDDLRLSRGAESLRILWENVPGVLSTRDNAFGCFLGGLAGHGEALVSPDGKRWPDAGVVSGPRRVVAWRILDAQWYGVAQRRRRVFVYALGGAGKWAAADALLPLGEGVQRHPPARPTAGKSVTGTLASRTSAGGGLGTDFDLDGGLIAARLWDTVGALCADTHPGAYSGQDAYTGRLVPVAFDPTQITSATNRSNPQPGDPCHTLAKSAHPPAIAYGFQSNDKGSDSVLENLSPVLRVGAGGKSGNPPAIAFESRYVRNGRGAPSEDVFPPLKAQSGETGKGDAAPLVATFQQSSMTGKGTIGYDDGDVAKPVKTQMDGQMLQTGMVVRRLTVNECARLQGFPDDWARIPWRGKPADQCPDGPQYKSYGNSMATPVIRWLGQRMMATR